MRLTDGDYWIDDYGSWNHVALGQLCPFLASPGMRHGQRKDVAFRHLGMVRVTSLPGTVTVQWDIAEACDESLNAACAFLWDMSDITQATLRYYFGGWTHETFGSVRDALARLEELRRYRDIAPFPDTRIKPLDQEAMERAVTPIIRRTRQLVAKNQHRFDAVLCNRLAEEQLMDQIVLFQEEDGGEWLSYRYLGQSSLFSQVFGTGALKDHIGRHCAVDPSRNRHGYSVSRAYPKVMASGKEQIEQVLAPIRQAGDDGVWVSYQRLLAPCSAHDGRRLLLVMADPTQESLIAA